VKRKEEPVESPLKVSASKLPSEFRVEEEAGLEKKKGGGRTNSRSSNLDSIEESFSLILGGGRLYRSK